MKIRLLLALLFVACSNHAQYKFSGYLNDEYSASTLYLSIIEDYRKRLGIE